MPDIPELLTMLKAGVHFGHRESKWHPKMAPFIFTVRNGVHIIDLEKTAEYLKKALNVVRDTVARGGIILYVGTKKQAAPVIQRYAEEAGMPYVVERWLGGTLTNFDVINGLVKKLIFLEEKEQDPDYEKKYTKKERLDFMGERERLEKMVGGLRKLDRLPDLVYIMDIKEEKTAVLETIRRGIATVAVCDTNVNPERVTYPIPANDDATKSISLITRLITEAAKEGIALREKGNSTFAGSDSDAREKGNSENLSEEKSEDK